VEGTVDVAAGMATPAGETPGGDRCWRHDTLRLNVSLGEAVVSVGGSSASRAGRRIGPSAKPNAMSTNPVRKTLTTKKRCPRLTGSTIGGMRIQSKGAIQTSRIAPAVMDQLSVFEA
jgi:hypothetical protein